MTGKLVFESSRVAVADIPREAASAAHGTAPAARRRPPLPVVVGCPRSGTSLLAVMLDSHPEVAVPPETTFLGPVAWLYGSSEVVRRGFFDVVTADRITVSNWSDFGLDKDEFWKRLEAIEPFTVSAGLRAFYALYAERERKPRYGEKTPGYVFVMPAIAALLPEAHFATVYAKPAGRPSVDSYITEVSQDTWILFPWDQEAVMAKTIIELKGVELKGGQ